MSTPAIPRTQTARSPRLAAAVLLSAAALALLNSTIANVALPSMQIALGLSPAAVSLTLAGWALAFALALIPAGKLGDRWGHKRVFLTGIAIFTVSSTLIALVQDDVQLIGLRLIQGLSGGLFYPAIAASLSMLFSGQARGRAFGALGGTLAAAAAVGPLLGGLVIELAGADLGWRLVFLLNLPLGLLILVGGVVLLPRRAGSGATGRVDSLGFALLALGLIGVLSALILGEQDGWPGWVWVVLALGIAVLVLFALWERRAQERGSDTVIAPALFQNRDFALSAVISFSQFAGFISIFYLLALLWQSGLGRSALDMGLLTLPEALAAVVGAALVQPLVTRWGSRVAVVTASVLLTAGMAGVALTLTAVPAAELSIGWLVAPLVVTGIGSGIGLSIVINHAMSTVDPRSAGVASGVIAAIQRAGNAVGLAIAGSVFFSVLAAIQRSASAPVAHDAAYASAAAVGLWVCAAMTVVALVASFFLRRPARS